MAKNHEFSPFLFPSSFPSYAPESTPESPLSPPPYASRSNSSFNSPYKSSSPSIPGPPLSQSSSVHPPAAAPGPCAACKINGRQCSDQCYLASYFPSNEAHRFGVVDTVFGWGDLHKFFELQKNSNSSNYIPLLVLLRDTSEDGEVQSNPRNCGLTNVDNKFVTLSSNSDNFSADTIMRSRDDPQFNPYIGGAFGYNGNTTQDLNQQFQFQFQFPTVNQSPGEVPHTTVWKPKSKMAPCPSHVITHLLSTLHSSVSVQPR